MVSEGLTKLQRPGLTSQPRKESKIRKHFAEIHGAALERQRNDLTEHDLMRLAFVPPYDGVDAERWFEDAKALDDEECRCFLAWAMVEIKFLQKQRKEWVLRAADHRRSKSEHAKKAADARHSQSGGYREKASAIKKAWNSGKYKTRDACARDLADSLGLSFKAARKHLTKKHLIGTSAPTE